MVFYLPIYHSGISGLYKNKVEGVQISFRPQFELEKHIHTLLKALLNVLLLICIRVDIEWVRQSVFFSQDMRQSLGLTKLSREMFDYLVKLFSFSYTVNLHRLPEKKAYNYNK